MQKTKKIETDAITIDGVDCKKERVDQVQNNLDNLFELVESLCLNFEMLASGDRELLTDEDFDLDKARNLLDGIETLAKVSRTNLFLMKKEL